MDLREHYKLAVLLKVAKLPKATYRYHQKIINSDVNKDQELEDLIKEIFLNNKERYGYQRITLVLKSLGQVVNHKKVLRLMRKIKLNGLSSVKYLESITNKDSLNMSYA